MTSRLDEFLTKIRAADNTKRAYKNTLTLFTRKYGHLPKSSEESQAFIAYREESGLKPATVGLDVAALIRYMRWEGMSTSRMERMPIILKTPQYLSKDEIKRLLAGCESSLTASLVALLYDAGARISEVLNIRLVDIDWNGFLFVTRKGGRQEWANVSEWGMSYLAKWMDDRKGKHPRVYGYRQYSDMYRLLKNAAKTADIDTFTPHMLRHSRAVHLRQEGLSWEEIGYQLGHVNPTITVKYYTRPDQYDLKKVVPPVSL
jgi:integrase